MKKTESQVSYFDFTAWCCEEYDPMEFQQLLNKIADKWGFQKETTKSGKMHYQGRLHLKVKNRPATLAKHNPWLGDLSITSKANMKNYHYQRKEDDSKLEGPWLSHPEDEDDYIPRDVRKMEKLTDWQEEFRKELAIIKEREIDIIYDPQGNHGKTAFVRWMCVHKLGAQVPFGNDFKDLMQIVMCIGPKPIYFIDMPRAIKKEKLSALFSAIESIKNGYAYDTRYSFKQSYFDPPRVVVFTNNIPELEYLSIDRWQFWRFLGAGRTAALLKSSVEDLKAGNNSNGTL